MSKHCPHCGAYSQRTGHYDIGHYTHYTYWCNNCNRNHSHKAQRITPDDIPQAPSVKPHSIKTWLEKQRDKLRYEMFENTKEVEYYE